MIEKNKVKDSSYEEFLKGSLSLDENTIFRGFNVLWGNPHNCIVYFTL